MAVNNYLKGYPYLFVRETDQTNYFCTICDGFLKEEELQSHLFDAHRAEDCNGYFVRVCVEQTDKGYFTQKKYIFVCVVCWGKFPSSTDMSSHRLTCKISPPTPTTSDEISVLPNPKRRTPPNRRISNSGNRIIEETEPTNVISTPDIPYIVDSDDEGGYPGRSTNGPVNRNVGVSPPISTSPPEIILEHSSRPSPGYHHHQQAQPVKRGRKKQLHPQQVLPPYRLEERFRSGTPTTNGGRDDQDSSAQQQQPTQQQQQLQQAQFASQFLQCSLCTEIMPTVAYPKHLREFHRVGSTLDNTLCPLCVRVVSLVDLTLHLATSHGVVPQSAVNALLLWVLTTNNFVNNNNSNNDKLSNNNKEGMMKFNKPSPSPGQPANGGNPFGDEKAPVLTMGPPMLPPGVNFPMMLQNVFPSLGGKLPLPVGKLFPPPISVSSSSNLPPLPIVSSSGGLTSAGSCPPGPIPSFLQALLNGESPSGQPPIPTADDRRSFAPPASPMPSKLAVESVVSKLTRRHVGPNDKESFQCLICAKWFAIPPVKHMRGHMVTFRDEKRRYVPLTGLGGSCHVCLVCFQVSESLPSIEFHMATFHPIAVHQQQQQQQQQQQPSQHAPEDDLPLGATYETANNNAKYNNNNNTGNNHHNNGNNNGGHVNQDSSPSDPKGVELDNAGRVKSGKVRKQCELCGQWSNIKWFFKHMSEVHRALFCRCCREYLPIHEQEEHRRWHSEPPYMGQKIRIENGQPIIIDRKERASLTPIGSLAAWGGSSGGMVVKAIDDAVVPSARKRKAAAAAAAGGNSSSAGASDAGASTPPSKIAPAPLFGGQDLGVMGRNGKDTLMPKETCPVCGILITYKNLARHIKLRHKIKYKFCHKCRKFVPNDTYEDHKVTCIQVASSPTQRSEHNESVFSEPYSGGDLSDSHRDPMEDDIGQPQQGEVHDCIDLSNASSSAVGTTPPSSLTGDVDGNSGLFDGRKSDSFRANTSKTKLESLLGKEFKHPRRRCAICGYTVSYSNFKRHLRNAHPNEYSQCEKDPGVDFGNAYANFSHIVEDDQPGLSKDSSDAEANGSGNGSFVECRTCGDHILHDFLPRHMKMNHPEEDETENDENDLDNNDTTKESCDENEAPPKHLDGDDQDMQVVDEEEKQSVVEPEVDETPGPIGSVTSTTKAFRMRECPVCKVEMRAESVVKHCKLKHKLSYKFCNVCTKYIAKKSYRSHVRKHVQGGRPNTRFGGDDGKLSSSQEEEETEEEESVQRPHNGGGHEDDDLDDDEDKLTIDFKGSSDEKSTEFKTSSFTEEKTVQSQNNELIKDNTGTKD